MNSWAHYPQIDFYLILSFVYVRKREREAEIAVEEEVKAKKEWQKQWEVSVYNF